MKAKRRIHRFNFDQATMKSGNKTHVALVDQAANMTEALVMKSVAISTKTQTFEEYDEEGNSVYSSDSVRIVDDGSSYVRVTQDSHESKNYLVRIR